MNAGHGMKSRGMTASHVPECVQGCEKDGSGKKGGDKVFGESGGVQSLRL